MGRWIGSGSRDNENGLHHRAHGEHRGRRWEESTEEGNPRPGRVHVELCEPAALVGNVLYKRLQRVHGFARRWRNVGGNPLKIGPWRIEGIQGAGLTSALRSFAISFPSWNLTLKMIPSGIRQV